jgi:radical SAM superfamily enzyme YgiQ (UPF0313 family)
MATAASAGWRAVERPLLIYLADPTHDGTGRPAVEIFPYNVGLVGSYARHALGDAVEIQLFKYVGPLLKALDERPPNVLGCSNYCWNTHLSHFLCGRAKRAGTRTLTVFGGTNYPFDAAGQLEFLRQRPDVDFHTFYEGERAFTELIRSFLACRDPRELRERPVSGCQAISPTTGRLVSGLPVPRIKTLDEIPSPYLTGLLDPFFDGILTPLLETNRGCPFTCNFCNAGSDYYAKVNMFSVPYLREEWRYIAPRAASAGVTTAYFADTNFGMYPRDAELCRLLKDLQEEFGWPHRIISTTGKNNKQRVVRATEILGTAISVNMSAQSMTPAVLKNIKRSNISLKAFKDVNTALLKQGRLQKGELISCLPGESFQSFMDGLRQMMESGTQQIYSYTLELLYGTEYKEPAYRAKWGYAGKWRMVPQDWGEYDGVRVFDVEEVAVQSSTMSFDDYLKVRMICLLTESMYNEYQYYELLKYLRQFRLSPADWIWRTLDRAAGAPAPIRAIFDSFLADTKGELYDSEEALFAHFRREEHFEKLRRGEAGHNVVMTHKGLLISQHVEEWIEFITRTCADLILDRVPGADGDTIASELGELRRYLVAKWRGVLNARGDLGDVVETLDHDVLAWVRESSARTLASFRLPQPVTYRFYFTEAQLRQRAEDMRRFGYDRTGFAKLYARGMSYDPFRHVERLADDRVPAPVAGG